MSCVACRCVFCKISIRARKHKIILPDPLLESRIRSTELYFVRSAPQYPFRRFWAASRTAQATTSPGRAPQLSSRRRACPTSFDPKTSIPQQAECRIDGTFSRVDIKKNKTDRIPAGTPNSGHLRQRNKRSGTRTSAGPCI